jgi:prevent-host-death family protein
MVRFSEDVVGVSELKVRGAKVIEKVVRTGRPTLVARRGRGVAVLVELSEFERMQDELAFRQAVDEGAKAAQAGRLRPHADAVRILESFGAAPRRRP